MYKEEIRPFPVQHHGRRVDIIAVILRLYLYSEILPVGKRKPGPVKAVGDLSCIPVYDEIRCHAAGHEIIFFIIHLENVAFYRKSVQQSFL